MHSNSDLQATQYVINLFEKSKAQSEEALEALPSIYAVIDAQGKILKGNRNLAGLFHLDYEKLLDQNISSLLSGDHLENFKAALASQSSAELRVDLKGADQKTLHYLWDLSPFKGARGDLPPLFSLVGKDVTDLTTTTQQKTRMQLELNTARMVQERLFQAPTAQFKGGSLAGHYEPASECGGDWWHYSEKNGKVTLWIGDVTGHGVAAAMVVSAINSAVSLIGETEISPAQALSRLNKIVHSTGKDQLTMTFFVATVDLKTRECVFASAAHEPVFCFPAGEVSYRDLKTLPFKLTQPLGAKLDQNFEEHKEKLQPGQKLFLFTDGLKDVKSPDGKKWENLKLQRVLAPIVSQKLKPQPFVEALKTKIAEHRQGTALADDVTFVVFEVE